MSNSPVKVYIIEDDRSVASAYAGLMRSAKMEPQTFATVEDFLSAEFSDQNACVVSGVQLPGKSGLELPELLRQAGYRLPVIFVTAHDLVEIRETAQRVGASGFFVKPVDDQELLDAIVLSTKEQQGLLVTGSLADF
jgi:FixJ family two-component response regulator